uniref:Cytochrome p450 3049B2 n=1 Tax=Brachionus koreanus TaxID=1199090 RepID=W8RKW9_9BILA|nr:cytochrome p450 3049B2 [Brachionus koreanus]
MFETKVTAGTFIIFASLAFISYRFTSLNISSKVLSSEIIKLVTRTVIMFFMYKTYKIHQLRQKYRHIPGPKTNGLLGFYLGNIPELLKLVKHKMVPDILTDWVKEYGPCFKYQILDEVSIFTISPEAIKEMYIDKNFPKHPDIYAVIGFPYGSRYMGTSLVTSLDNVRHRHRRHIMNPAFSRQALNSFMDELNAKSDVLMNKLRNLADGKTTIRMLDELNNLTLDVIAAACFGMQNDSITKENNFKKFVFESLRGLNRLLFNPTIKYNPFEWGYIRRYKELLNDLRNLGRTQINNRIKALQDGSYVKDDLITLMVKNSKEDNIDIEDLVDDFLTFFVAGQETTSNMLAFSLLELGQNPDVLKTLKEEVDSTIGSKQHITTEDLNKLKYLESVIKETLRKWSITPLINRQSAVPIKIYDFDIPVGSEIQVSSYVSGRMDEFFPNPKKFDPERFYNNEGKIKNYTYFPFSLGPRNCIGQNFSIIEGKICLAKFVQILILNLVQNFDFKLDPNQSFEGVQHATINPASGTMAILEIRK